MQDNEALEVLRDLLEWEQRMGGWESPVWERARQLVAASKPTPFTVVGEWTVADILAREG